MLTPVLRTANFNADGSLDYESPAMRCIPERKVRTKRMQRGDIILEKSGGTPNRPVGIMAYYDSDELALCSNFNHVLRFDADAVNPFFMFHQLRWLREQGSFASYTRKTTGLQNLQMKTFVNLELRVPSRSIQDAAADEIRLIDSERNRLTTFGEKLDKLVKSRFVEMFGDPDTNPKRFDIKPGSKLFKLGNGKAKPSSERFKEGVPAYGGNGISWYTNEALVEHATIVIGRVGRHCGNTRLVDNPCWVTDNAMFIRDFKGESFDLIFLSWLMEIIGFNRFADKGDLWKITQKPFMEYVYYVPPLSLQQEFAAFVAQVDKLKADTQLAIDKLQLLYDSLAQEYFGEV